MQHEEKTWPPAPICEALPQVGRRTMRGQRVSLPSFCASVCGTVLFLGPMRANRLLEDTGHLSTFNETLIFISCLIGLLCLIAALVGGLIARRTRLGQAAVVIAAIVLIGWGYARFVCQMVF